MMYKGTVVLKKDLIFPFFWVGVILLVVLNMWRLAGEALDLPIVEIDRYGKCVRVLVIENDAEVSKSCKGFDLKKKTYTTRNV